MTNEKLIEEIIELYRVAKKSTEKFKDPCIKRGRNHSISSQTEDLLAYFIFNRCNLSGFEIWVDYPISFKSINKKTKKGNPGTKTIYPDISIVRKNNDGHLEIVEMIDLKMDLGWKRELKEYIDKTHKLIVEIRQVKTATYKKIDENGFKIEPSLPVKISSNLKWRIPIISNENIQSKKMRVNIDYSNSPIFNDVLKMYIFTKEKHPNSGFAIINDKEINQFITDIKAAT